MRGEYKGVEGKVEKVDTRSSTLHIEGIQRDKVRGGQVKVPIHSSNVLITGLKMDDKYRATMLAGKEKPAKKEEKPKGEKEEDS
jgi:large subunit ribosomal protein L24